MRNALRLGFIVITALPALAGDVRTINATCEKAITKAEVLAAERKWWPDRPDPKAPVLNVRTHANFAKQALLPLGSVWSHEKVGELAFQELDQSCRVTSNGHPADVVLSDLVKAEFPAPTAQSATAPVTATSEMAASEPVADAAKAGSVKPCKQWKGTRLGPLYCAER